MNEIIARPAEIIIAQGNSVITSLALGSSLGICLYDAEKQIGGYVHSILPEERAQGKQDLKYVNHAVTKLYEAMLKAGSDPQYMQAKLIGGAKLFHLPEELYGYDVGKANVKSACHILEKLDVPIVKEDVGNVYGRTIHFHVEDGLVYIETRNKHLYYI